MVQEVVGVSSRVRKAELPHLVDQGPGDFGVGETIFQVFFLHQEPVNLAAPDSDVIGEGADVDKAIVIVGGVVV